MATPAAIEQRLLADGRALRALASNLLRGMDGAEDVVQDTWLAATAGPSPCPERPWLLVTLRHLAAMWRRSTRRRAARELFAAKLEVQESSDPAVIAQNSELIRDVGAAVHALEEPFRTVVVLRYWHGLQPEAIATELGVPRNTVRSRLQRGLARLRADLDAKHGVRERWAAPLAAATRISVVAAANGFGIAGLIMKTKLFVVAAVLATAVAVPVLWPEDRAVASLSPAPTALVALSTDRGSTGEIALRELVPLPAAEETTAAPPPAPPAPPGPWTALLLVEDEDHRPIADASIALYVGRQDGVRPDGRALYSGRDPQHCLEMRTDATGRATAVLELGAYVAVAGKDGCGRSRERWLFRTHASKEQRLVLEAEILLDGIVRESDGSPVPGIEVAVTVRPSTATLERGMPLSPGPVVTGADGRFRFAVQREVGYTLSSRHAGRESFPVDVWVTDADPPKVTVTFPGAINLTGCVVDVDGRPVADAEVAAWREHVHLDPVHGENEQVKARTDQRGRFAVPVRRHARYQLLAAAPGHATSEIVWTETTPQAPDVDVRLVLATFASIRGRVVHADGSPVPGLKVLATPEAGDRHMWIGKPSREDRFPKVPAATVADDGAFSLVVHPGTSWTLEVRLAPANWRLRILRSGIRPGRDDVVITVSDAELRGCVVSGRVTRADGEPAADFRLEVVSCDEQGEAMHAGTVEPRIDGDKFSCPPLGLGQKYVLRALLANGEGPDRFRSPLALATTDVFVSDRAELHFDLCLEGRGNLPVQVLEADGSPARNARVYVRRIIPSGFDHASQEVDAQGVPG